MEIRCCRLSSLMVCCWWKKLHCLFDLFSSKGFLGSTIRVDPRDAEEISSLRDRIWQGRLMEAVSFTQMRRSKKNIWCIYPLGSGGWNGWDAIQGILVQKIRILYNLVYIYTFVFGPKITRLRDRPVFLPEAHTCFNQLVLPDYADRETLQQKLVIALSNAEGFGLE